MSKVYVEFRKDTWTFEWWLLLRALDDLRPKRSGTRATTNGAHRNPSRQAGVTRWHPLNTRSQYSNRDNTGAAALCQNARGSVARYVPYRELLLREADARSP